MSIGYFTYGLGYFKMWSMVLSIKEEDAYTYDEGILRDNQPI